MKAKLALALWLATAPVLAQTKGEDPAVTPKAPKPIEQHYQDALQYYAQSDYRRAILEWNEALKVDPTQKTAQTMIAEARSRIEIATRERRDKMRALIAKGRFREARLEAEWLIDQDPGNPQLEGLMKRLDSVMEITTEGQALTKGGRMALLGLSGYLGLPEDQKLAHNALRYAVELEPQNPTFKAYLKLLLDDHPSLADDEITPGMKLLEYKQAVALHQIYDAKFHLAVIALNEILALEPNDLGALKRLGTAYYSLGRKAKAREAWGRALKLAPQDETLKKFYARVEGVKGAKGAALTVEEP